MATKEFYADKLRVLLCDRRKGSINPGMDADLCVFDENINVQAMFIGGHKI